MNLRLILLSIAIIGLIACNDATGQKKVALKSKSDSLSYAVGAQVAFNLKKDSLEVDVDMIAAGIKDYLQNDSTKYKMNMDEIVAIFQKLGQEIQSKQQSAAAAQSAIDNKASNEFFEKNGKEAGIVTVEGGLQYKVLKMGTGAKPKASDKVKVHYTGKFLSGKVFDSSVERGQPTEFQVDQVIPGWTQGLQLMPIGSKWILYIPSSLGYGEQGAGGVIPPNSTLIFEVELLEIVK